MPLRMRGLLWLIRKSGYGIRDPRAGRRKLPDARNGGNDADGRALCPVRAGAEATTPEHHVPDRHSRAPASEDLLAVARRAADAAADVHRAHAGRLAPSSWSEKGRSDFVTEVDLDSVPVESQSSEVDRLEHPAVPSPIGR